MVSDALFSDRSLAQSREYALNSRTAHVSSRTNRLDCVLAQAGRAHQRLRVGLFADEVLLPSNHRRTLQNATRAGDTRRTRQGTTGARDWDGKRATPTCREWSRSPLGDYSSIPILSALPWPPIRFPYGSPGLWTSLPRVYPAGLESRSKRGLHVSRDFCRPPPERVECG